MMVAAMSRVISIATDFTRHPGPRYENDGPYSGEAFRKRILVPALEQAIRSGDKVTVWLDDVAGYGSSFLEEAFGGLIRTGFSKAQLDKHLVVAAKTNRFQHHALRAKKYIEEAASRNLH